MNREINANQHKYIKDNLYYNYLQFGNQERENPIKEQILVTGATGYIGGRLVPRLLELGFPVRCMVRDAHRLEGYPWREKVQVAEGDALDPHSLIDSMKGVASAFYLIQGQRGGDVDIKRDLRVAQNFASAAEAAGVRRIIYLGELVDSNRPLGPYFESRQEIGQILCRGSVPVTEFRAGMVIGPGSALFEMVRYVAERQPVFICPTWWFSQAQPIAVNDVIEYLLQALELPLTNNQSIEIGGATQLTYAQMLQGYSHERGFKRLLIPFPLAIPRLSAYWVHMVTPIHWRVVLPLIQGLQAENVVRNNVAKVMFPHIQPLDYVSALRQALGRVLSDDVETSWSDSLAVSQGDVRPVTMTTSEGMMFERRQSVLDLPAHPIFQAYTGLGGKRGWLYMNWTWSIRGWIDKLVGGVGLRRGRRHPNDLRVGESLDFWRVEAVEPDCLVRLRAEMRLPGKAWLEFRSIPEATNRTLLTQTAYFAPKGLAGFLYWYLLYPIHGFIFSGMIRKIAERAQDLAQR